ncbi:MAG: beta-propeller fold lactonase family protein [Elusimicrobia bacterium]|nr:beta-propeller fold lactonase family protein [Elusimicrobiota bacterium]
MKQLTDKIFVGVWAVLLASALHGTTPARRIYLGTYTGEKSEGIYTATFDPATGMIGPVELAAKTENPSFSASRSAKRSLTNWDPTQIAHPESNFHAVQAGCHLIL